MHIQLVFGWYCSSQLSWWLCWFLFRFQISARRPAIP